MVETFTSTGKAGMYATRSVAMSEACLLKKRHNGVVVLLKGSLRTVRHAGRHFKPSVNKILNADVELRFNRINTWQVL